MTASLHALAGCSPVRTPEIWVLFHTLRRQTTLIATGSQSISRFWR